MVGDEPVSRKTVVKWLESELRFYGLSEGVAVLCHDPESVILRSSLPAPDRVIEVSGLCQQGTAVGGI